MTYVEWPSTVNTRFFNLTDNPQDNYKTTEYASGRKVTILKNTRFIHDKKCSILVTKTQSNAFWEWFENVLGGCAGIFHCKALKGSLSTSSEYFKFKTTPTEQQGLKYKEISIEIEEIY